MKPIKLNVIGLNVVNMFSGESKSAKLTHEWETTTITNNPEWKRVYVDLSNRILYGVHIDGSKYTPNIADDIKKDILILERKNK